MEKSALRVKQIIWNDALNLQLLECILQTGAHVAPHGKSTEVWEAVNHMFFMQPETQALKEGCYQPGKHRKFIEQYKELQTQAAKSPAWQEFQGRNLSAIDEAEPNKIWKLLRRLELEKSDKVGLSKAKDAERLKLMEIEKAVTKDPVLQPTKRQRIKSIDGSISGKNFYCSS